MFDPNREIEFDQRSAITLGFNYFINEWTRIQVNYLYNVEESSSVDINNYFEIPNDMLLVQFQIKF